MSNVDLSGLRIDEASAAIPKRPIGPRLLVAAVIALALAVAATFLVPILWPPRAVRMAAVQPESHSSQTSSTATAEAVGWVEPDPYPFIVRPLVSGRIETMEVLEGTVITANETNIAHLASAALLAASDRSKAIVAEHVAEVGRAKAKRVLAKERLEQNADAVLRVQDARAKLAGTTTKLSTANERRRQTQAQAESAKADLRAQERLQEAGQTFPVALQRAQADAKAAHAAITASDAEVDGLRDEREEAQATVDLCEQLAADPVDLRGAVAIAAAELQKANATLAKANVDATIAARELNWATVRSPRNGVVMRLEAEPGDIVGPGAKGAIAIYDPKKLRARIDVPIDSLRGIYEGQKVEITSEAIGNTIVVGVVQRLQHETDMLKNTLQVKIGLIDPPTLLRPETLCRARFLAGKQDGKVAVVSAFRVPAAAVHQDHVFIFDPKSGTARAVPIEVIGEDGDLRIVRGALSPTHRVVLEPVTDGEAIKEATL